MRTLFPHRGTPAYELLRTLMNAEDERVCQQDPELWWMTDYPSVQVAKRLCQGCPLQATCGEYAILAVEPAGVWGGLSPEDRLTIRRRRTKAKTRATARAKRKAEQQTTTAQPEEQAS